MKLLFRGLWLLIIALFICATLVAQEEEEEEELEEVASEVAWAKDTINLSRFLGFLNTKQKDITLSDYYITDSEDDKVLKHSKHYVFHYILSLADLGTKKINLYNCEFVLSEGAYLIISNAQLSKFNMVGCVFECPIKFENASIMGRYPMTIENCYFKSSLEINHSYSVKGSIMLRNNDFSHTLSIDMGLSELLLEQNRFYADSGVFLAGDYERTHYQFMLGTESIENAVIHANTFNNNGLDWVYSVSMAYAGLAELQLLKNQMYAMDLSGASIEKALLVDSLYVSHYLGILNFDFPEKNTNVSWFNLSGEKFAIFNTEATGMVIPYQAKSDEQLSNNLMYNDLMSAYNKFNSLYQDRGDIVSANASYVEIKNIETRKQAHIQSTHPSFNNLINYKLNVFLRFFSDYATNPGKSLIQSLWVILIFSMLYMISFSRWDGMNYRYFLNQYKNFSEYIRNTVPIEDIYIKEEESLKNDLEVLKNQYVQAGKELPRILKLLGGPLHFLGKFRYRIIPKLIRLFNFQPKGWELLSTGQKIGSGLMIVIICVCFLSYVLVVKAFNSVVMSLNSFVVIGFGAIPDETDGFAMYLSIIEGIIGWFLLTIFTITLLSQVLQAT